MGKFLILELFNFYHVFTHYRYITNLYCHDQCVQNVSIYSKINKLVK